MYSWGIRVQSVQYIDSMLWSGENANLGDEYPSGNWNLDREGRGKCVIPRIGINWAVEMDNDS